MRYAFLGPSGTFSEDAAIRYYLTENEGSYYLSNSLVIEALNNDKVDEAFVAIENSLEGSVSETIDSLIGHPELKIKGEFILVIKHQLIAKQNIPLDQIKIILSHPQAIAQCRQYINDHLSPNIIIETEASTTKALERILNHSVDPLSSAVIGSSRAAEYYKMTILDQNIQDSENNNTRFVAVAKNDGLLPTGSDKTSIIFTCERDEPGSLVNVLQVFKKFRINMSKIESRPSKKMLGDYIFLVDFKGHHLEDSIHKALEMVRNKTTSLRILGSYPRANFAEGG